RYRTRHSHSAPFAIQAPSRRGFVSAHGAAVRPLSRSGHIRRAVRASTRADRAGFQQAMNENELIARLKHLFPRIGDDAAVVDDLVITTDMLVEDVDFTRAIPIELVARKSLAANLSDLAAMGARPAYAVVALGAPPWLDVE